MLRIQFSNRIETLREAVVEAIARVPASPFTAQRIVVPSTAMRRYLTLAIAERHGICANVDCVYLAEWLWQQIAQVVLEVAPESPFAASALQWRIYQALQTSDWAAYPRLANYLKDPSAVLCFELAADIAQLFEQYITYRQDWLNAWLHGGRVAMPQAAAVHGDDQAWEAELWRRISGELGAAPEHPAGAFFRKLHTIEPGAANPFDLPESVHVFCLAAVPPLYLSLLTGLARWVDVTLYVLNPCREYWFDIVDPRRLLALTARGAADHHETGNRLLASWGKQTRTYLGLLLDHSGDAPVDDGAFDERFPHTTLGRLQRSVFCLTELEPSSLAQEPDDRSLEIHVCHSLTRELEVLQDQLLTLFAGASAPPPEEILIVMPDLNAAAPLIEAVFGHVPDERRLPYAITGRGRSTENPAARALLALLALLPSRFTASALIELLQQPLIGRRFGIGAEELEVIEHWLAGSGMRWGLDAAHQHELELPGAGRLTVADCLDRLFLGYALPQRVSQPAFGRVPAGNAEGAQAGLLGSFAEFIAALQGLRAGMREARLPDAWLEALLGIVDFWLAPADDEFEDLDEVRETLRQLHADMRRGGVAAPVPPAVVRTSLESLLDEPARGGVPTGAITFSSMSSLRNLPFRFIGIIGLDDGAFPSAARPREFDLMAAQPRAGDRQRRLEDRNLFLDLILAARERLYLSYTGRSIRDNSPRPPSVVVAELVETLLPALARPPGDAAALADARRQLIIEHPLQPFAEVYFNGSDARLRSFNRELCEALRHALPERPAPALPTGRTVPRFFAAALTAPGPEWRRVTLEQLLQFFRNPCRFLLRHRLGLILQREADAVSDEEPFLADHASRQALAERLLPQVMQGLSATELHGLAQAGIEYPAGALGATALHDEMGALQRFAREVAEAGGARRLPPLAAGLPFHLQGEDWQLTALFAERRETGLVLHRYDDTRPSDHLTAWLTHLVAAAASPTPLETRWISRNGSFLLRHVSDARALLEPLLMLYRRGLREPIHFFPKSAWAYIRADRNLLEAQKVWRPAYGDLPGEEAHAAYRLALRGVADPLDADFKACAETVFSPSLGYLEVADR